MSVLHTALAILAAVMFGLAFLSHRSGGRPWGVLTMLIIRSLAFTAVLLMAAHRLG